MTPHADKASGQKLSFSSRFHQAFEASFNRLVLRYKSGVKWFFRRKWLVGAGVIASIALLAVLMKKHQNRTWCPDEDMGTVSRQRDHASGQQSVANHQGYGRKWKPCIKDIPQIERYSNVAGYSMLGGQAASGGMLTVKLKNWDERQEDEDYITAAH